MHTLGEYIGAQRTINGELVVSFAIDETSLEELEKLKGIEIVLDVQKFHNKRSNQANRYLWKLCDLIAEKLNSTKEVVYLMYLKDAGIWEDWEIPADAVNEFSKLWRYTEVQYTFTTAREIADGEYQEIEMAELRCWRGSHEYDKKQMQKLLNEVVFQAQALGIETMTPAEIAQAIALWEAKT